MASQYQSLTPSITDEPLSWLHVDECEAGTAISRAEIESMSPKDFVDAAPLISTHWQCSPGEFAFVEALTGVALEEPFPVEAT